MEERERMRGFFERRGREGYAKGAKEEKKKRRKKKEKQDEIKKANKAQINPLKHIFLILNFFGFLFCALCVTFAPSAFKKSPTPIPIPTPDL
jgi:hypothetical protein